MPLSKKKKCVDESFHVLTNRFMCGRIVSCADGSFHV